MNYGRFLRACVRVLQRFDDSNLSPEAHFDSFRTEDPVRGEKHERRERWRE